MAIFDKENILGIVTSNGSVLCDECFSDDDFDLNSHVILVEDLEDSIYICDSCNKFINV